MRTGFPGTDHIYVAKLFQVVALATGREDIPSELDVSQHSLGRVGCLQRSVKNSKSVTGKSGGHARH